MRRRAQSDLLNKGDIQHAECRVHRTGIENHWHSASKFSFWTL